MARPGLCGLLAAALLLPAACSPAPGPGDAEGTAGAGDTAASSIGGEEASLAPAEAAPDGAGDSPASTEDPETGPAGDSTTPEAPADTLAAAPAPRADSLAADTAGPADDAPPPLPPVLVPPGTLVRVASDAAISTATHRVGDAVVTMVLNDVTDRRGTILIRQGTLFLARVSASSGSGGVGEPAILELDFQTLSAPDYERPVEALVLDADVRLDLDSEIARRLSRDRRRVLATVPGSIAAGSTIQLQLRAPVRVPADSLGNARARPDTAAADSVP